MLLILAGCAKRNTESLALQGGIIDDPGGGGDRGCPWTAIESVRIDPDTLWINESPWSVRSPAAGEAFAELLAVCGEPDAVEPFLAWRALEQDQREQKQRDASKRSMEEVATVLIAGAAVAAAGQTPGNEALSHAIRDENLEPASPDETPAADPDVTEARQAVVDALMGS